MTVPSDWLAINLANWNERVPIHLNAPLLHYDLDPLRQGKQQLDPIAAGILGPVDGLRVLHLQCHFGQETLALAQQGATVVGLDFSQPAIAAARSLAADLKLAHRARFVEANLYDAEAAIDEPSSFDRVFVCWGALVWLPDLTAWGRIVASFLKPNGFLALAEAHPAAFVFDDRTSTPDGRPGWHAPYLARQALIEDQPADYADPTARLKNSRTVEFLHPLSDIIMSLINAGLRIDRFEEHASITWQLFACLKKLGRNEHVWPDKPWLPLSFSLRAAKP